MIKFSETHNLAADIRNKLTPFWNLVAIIRSGDYPKFDIEKEAQAAFENQMTILYNLDKMILIAEALGDQCNELQNDVNELCNIESDIRVYGEPVPKSYGDLMTIEDWNDAINEGYIIDSDGIGYWVKDGMRSRDEVFSTAQKDATHVAWYNK